MKARIVRIGNSRGVRIPKPMLEEAGLEDEVEIEVSAEGIRITPTRTAREGWAAAAAELGERGEGALLDPETATAFDETDWEW